jgi:hypothetical protein
MSPSGFASLRPKVRIPSSPFQQNQILITLLQIDQTVIFGQHIPLHGVGPRQLLDITEIVPMPIMVSG